MAGLNLVKSSMLYVQGDEEEGKEIAKIVASVPMNMILSKIKIQIIAAMGIILPALRPLFCMLLPIFVSDCYIFLQELRYKIKIHSQQA